MEQAVADESDERSSKIHSSTSDEAVDARQTNVGVSRFLSTSVDKQLDGVDDADLEKRE